MNDKLIEEMLKDDPELSDFERFELYYDERERRKEIEERKKLENNSVTYNKLLKKTGVKKPKKK